MSTINPICMHKYFMMSTLHVRSIKYFIESVLNPCGSQLFYIYNHWILKSSGWVRMYVCLWDTLAEGWLHDYMQYNVWKTECSTRNKRICQRLAVHESKVRKPTVMHCSEVWNWQTNDESILNKLEKGCCEYVCAGMKRMMDYRMRISEKKGWWKRNVMK